MPRCGRPAWDPALHPLLVLGLCTIFSGAAAALVCNTTSVLSSQAAAGGASAGIGISSAVDTNCTFVVGAAGAQTVVTNLSYDWDPLDGVSVYGKCPFPPLQTI